MKRLTEQLFFLPPAFRAGQTSSPSISPTQTNEVPSRVGTNEFGFGQITQQLLGLLQGAYCQPIAIRTGEQVIRSGCPLRFIYVVRAGYFKAEYALHNGQHQITQFLCPDDLLGLDGMATGWHYLDFMALCDCNLVRVDYEQLNYWLKANTDLKVLFDKIVGRTLIEAQDHIFSLGSHNTEQKLTYFLLDFQGRQGNQVSAELRLPMGRDDLASYLGVTVESLSRAFALLERNRLLNVSNRLVSEIDTEGLTCLLLR
jgi:CRP/FNR family transcriptional regulator